MTCFHVLIPFLVLATFLVLNMFSHSSHMLQSWFFSCSCSYHVLGSHCILSSQRVFMFFLHFFFFSCFHGCLMLLLLLTILGCISIHSIVVSSHISGHQHNHINWMMMILRLKTALMCVFFTGHQHVNVRKQAQLPTVKLTIIFS